MIAYYAYWKDLKTVRSNANTVQEMRDAEAPTPKTVEELSEYITSLVDRKHDYGTCVYAMSLAATAAFNHVAHKLGATGFQASCADLDILRRTRSIEGPFIILEGEYMLYPQYDLQDQLDSAISEWEDWASEEAAKKLAQNKEENIHPKVWAHWQSLAAHNSTKETFEDSNSVL